MSVAPQELSAEEKRLLGNELYKIIYPMLAQRECRGFNAHSRAQSIMKSVETQIADWIQLQIEHYEVWKANNP